MIPGPTIQMKAGEQCNVKIINDLTGTPCSYHENDFHCADTHTLHTHGLHVSPSEDNIDTHQAAGEEETYTYNIPENHLMGTHWYHAHHHGSTALHVGGGLIGALIVEPAVAYTLPPNLSKLYSAPSNNKVLVLTHHNFGGDDPMGPFGFRDYNSINDQFDPAENSVDPNPSAAVDTYLVNGQSAPEIAMVAGEVMVLRFIHAGAHRNIEVALGGNSCSMTLLARDGVFHTGSYLEIDSVVMVSGTRADVAVLCDADGTVTGSMVHTAATDGLLGNGNRHLQSTLFTLDVAPAGAGTNDTVTAVPTSEFADLPDYLTDLLDDADVIVGSEDGVETIDLGGGGNRGVNGDPFPGFGAEEYVAQFCVGNKYEMELGGGGNGASKHPYHHHINHFQIASYNNQDRNDAVVRVGEWRDVVPATSQIAFRFPAADFDGEVVLHCHMLEHEDEGLMGLYMIHPADACPDSFGPSAGVIIAIVAGAVAVVAVMAVVVVLCCCRRQSASTESKVAVVVVPTDSGDSSDHSSSADAVTSSAPST